MSSPRSASAATSVREQKLARVIDREVAPIWHDRFARSLLRDLPTLEGGMVLDIHTGGGHTTAELLQRLDESTRVVALGGDPLLLQLAKNQVRPEWKKRVYFKPGDIDDVPEMPDATYDLTVANVVLGEHVVDWKTALTELRRVTKPGGLVLATVPLHGTWDEVEDLFEELLRDEGMSAEVLTLKQLRRRRPKPGQIVRGLDELGISADDYVLEHERFELLFRSGREFLFAPVIEHGPLRLWKAILGRAEQPQALFWRFKEVIDTYYAGKVLAVSVVAGLIRLQVRGPTSPSFAATYWARFPELNRIWKGGGEDDEVDVDVDFGDDEEPAAAEQDERDEDEEDSGKLLSGSTELPALADHALDEDPFANLLDETEVPPLEPEPTPTGTHEPTASRATLGNVVAPTAAPRRPVKPTVALPTTPTTPTRPSPPARAPTPSAGRPAATPTPAPSARPTSGLAGGTAATATPARASAAGVPAPIAPTPSGSVKLAPLPPTTKPVSGPVAPLPPTSGKHSALTPPRASADLLDAALDPAEDLAELDEDELDLADSFGRIEPEPDASRSGSRKSPPPLPKK